jgi:glutaminyl-tRNA synthetase
LVAFIHCCACAGKVKTSLDAAVLALLGPKNDDDAKRAAESLAAKKAASKVKPTADSASEASLKASVPAAGAGATSETAKAEVTTSMFQARELKSAVNTPELIAEHNKITGGVLRTRFPPEPNGYLHIGHAKSMNLNFEGAFLALGKKPGVEGVTIFRYDDTNPEKENDIYIRSQADNVAWLGWKPVRTTHSSDYFPQLYDFAVQLIKKDKAFVCHQSKEEIENSREIARARDGRDPNSRWRNRPIAESLKEFEAMRYGMYEEGKATLRLKIDMTHSNPTMWDPIAYRIKYTPHPVSGDGWCIYPAYDYSHCIIDSLEHIDYSLCTLEFEVRRDIYYWVLEQLDLYRPFVWEFSRLNVTHYMLSKRKILKLVCSWRAIPVNIISLDPWLCGAGRGQKSPRLGRPTVGNDQRFASARLSSRSNQSVLSGNRSYAKG